MISSSMDNTGPSHPHVRDLFKSMLKGSSLYLLANVSPTIVSLLLVRIVTGRLTTADYGALDMIQQVSIVLSVVLGINFAEALGFFFFEKGADKARVVGTMFGGSLLLGALAGAAGWWGTGLISRVIFHSNDYRSLLHLIFTVMPLVFLLEVGLGWLRVEDRASLFAGLTIARMLISLVATAVLLVVFDMKVAGVVISNVAASVFAAILVVSAALKRYGVRFSAALLRRMLRFSSFITLSACAVFIIQFGDRFVLTQYRSYDQIGIYALAYKIGMLISLVQSAFGAYWAAQIFQLVKRPDAGWVFGRSLTYYLTGLCFCGVSLLVAARPALMILTRPAYFGALALIPIILLAYLWRSLGDFFRFVFMGLGQPRLDAISNWITAAVCLSAYFLLIPRYGILGAACATLITFVFMAILVLAWVRRIWPYHLELARLAKLGAVTAVVAGVHFLLPQTSFWPSVLEGVILMLAFIALLVLLRFPTRGETSSIRSVVFRLIPQRAAGPAGER